MENTFIQALEERFNYKFTENGAIALKSTGSKVYDLFAFGAAYRNRSAEDAILLFKNAYEEDPDLALKCLFYIRDCRGGQGERQFFRTCYKWLSVNDPAAARKNLKEVPNFGRWDDLLSFVSTPIKSDIITLIRDQLTLDMQDAINKKAISLLGKWMPSENASSYETKRKAKWVRTQLGMTSRQYRKMLSKLRNHLKVLEMLMSQNRWEEIEFDKIPSKAGLVYRNAFARNDITAQKYIDFIESKTTKVNANTLYPYEIVQKAINSFNSSVLEREVLNKYWENLPDYLEGKPASMLCVVDTSGSMTCGYGNSSIRPIDIAISLGMYCAERIGKPFKNHYISFSSRPQWISIEGIDFVDKVNRIYRTNLCENTNLTKVFDLVLDTVLRYGVKASDIPKTIVIISDMEIDGQIDGSRYYWDMKEDTKHRLSTTMYCMKRKWADAGLELPKLVYWNVCARNDTILDKGNGVTFVSGASPTIFKQVLTGKTGIELMLEVLLSERYKNIKA